jgi:hypothetical protein
MGLVGSDVRVAKEERAFVTILGVELFESCLKPNETTEKRSKNQPCPFSLKHDKDPWMIWQQYPWVPDIEFNYRDEAQELMIHVGVTVIRPCYYWGQWKRK